MNVRHQYGVLHSFPLKNYFYEKMDAKVFSFACDYLLTFTKEILKDALPGLRKLFPTESPFKMMKNAFYFILITLFILKQGFVQLIPHTGIRCEKLNSQLSSKTES